MTEIHQGWHYKIGPDGVPDKDDEWQDAKLLGEYTSRAKAEAAIARRSGEEGFRDWPHGFRIEMVPLDVGMQPDSGGSLVQTHDVWHFRIGRGDEEDIDDPAQAPIKLGVFSSERNAEAAIEQFRHDPRFRVFPDGFRVFSAPPDRDFWDGGFIPWNEA